MDEVLLTEVMKKAAVIWVEVNQETPRLLWTTWIDGAAYVVHGAGEQEAPELDKASECQVIARSADNQAQILRWSAHVNTVVPHSEQWQQVVPTLLGKRLNLTDAAEQRWASSGVVSVLTPRL